jgi:hypothetical protein
MMFRASSLAAPPDPVGGPFLRWHVHAVCDRVHDNGNPYQFEVTTRFCHRTHLAHYGPTQMIHVWLTRDLASAFAHAVPTAALGLSGPQGGNRFTRTTRKGMTMGSMAGAHHAATAAMATMGMGGDLSRNARWVVAFAWITSLLVPAAALGLAAARSHSIGGRAAAFRSAGIVLLLGVAATHASDLADHLVDAHYLAALFCALVVGSAVASIGLALLDNAGPAWLLAGVMSASSIAGYVVSRAVGLPQIPDHIGQWTSVAGVISLVAESALVAMSVCALASAAARENRLTIPAPARGLRRRPVSRARAAAG